MEWPAFALSLSLAIGTLCVLLPLGAALAHALAFGAWTGRRVVEALVALPLVLPPTVLGYYLLVGMAGDAPLGRLWRALTGHDLAFSFAGLVVASVLINVPFAVQPMQRALEAIPIAVRQAAATSGLSPWRTLWRIDLPLAWPGIVSALVLVFAHTMGEFGVVLMVGGNIPGRTRTASLAIYDRAQAFDTETAGRMAALLLAISLAAIAITSLLVPRPRARG